MKYVKVIVEVVTVKVSVEVKKQSKVNECLVSQQDGDF
jgi:hypothetical protein